MSLIPYGIYAATAYNQWHDLDQKDKDTLIKARNSVMRYGKRKFSGYMTAAKRRRMAKQKVGQRPQKKPAKVLEEVSGIEAGNDFYMKDTRTLYQHRLCKIEKNEAKVVGTGADAKVDTSDTKFKRRSNTVMLSGFKFCFEVDNGDTVDATKPMYVNFAVLVDKEAGNFGQPLEADFFRDLRQNKDRSHDFPNGSGLTSNEYHCLPINTDRFGVLKHKRMRLSGNNANMVGQFRNMDFFLRCKRQLRWDEGQQYPEGPGVYAVMWCCRFGDDAGKHVDPNQIKMHGRILTYFRG